MGSFTETPIYVPEIYELFDGITMNGNSEQKEEVLASYEGEGTGLKASITFNAQEMKPYLRYLLLKELFKFLCYSENEVASSFSKLPSEVIEIYSNIFAGAILVPENILKNEVNRIDSSIDLVAQLADSFWVSKSLINQRLRDMLENT